MVVDFFFEPGCPECEEVKKTVLPKLAANFEGFYQLRYFDMGETGNVVRLAAYQDALGLTANEPVSVFVDYRLAFNGLNEIRNGLLAAVEEAAVQRLDPNWLAPAPIAVPTGSHESEKVVQDRMQRFTLLAVIAGGLVDGLNPCAISTLVFFMSLLAIAKVKGRRLLLMGISFCLASFVTYSALGFGLLRVLHTFTGFPLLKSIIDTLLLAVLVVLGLLSLADAFRFSRSGKGEAVMLKLPNFIRNRIHGVMRNRLKTGNLMVAGMIIGTSVTALESVCTGQVYVPTLVVVIRNGRHAAQAWGYLLLYNAMFILPLVVVFILTYAGLATSDLLALSRRNVVRAKILLGLFFLGLAALVAYI